MAHSTVYDVQEYHPNLMPAFAKSFFALIAISFKMEVWQSQNQKITEG